MARKRTYRIEVSETSLDRAKQSFSQRVLDAKKKVPLPDPHIHFGVGYQYTGEKRPLGLQLEELLYGSDKSLEEAQLRIDQLFRTHLFKKSSLTPDDYLQRAYSICAAYVLDEKSYNILRKEKLRS